MMIERHLLGCFYIIVVFDIPECLLDYLCTLDSVGLDNIKLLGSKPSRLVKDTVRYLYLAYIMQRSCLVHELPILIAQHLGILRQTRKVGAEYFEILPCPLDVLACELVP